MPAKPDDESVLAYIGYATVSEVWSGIKTATLIFSVFGTVSLFFTVGFDWLLGGVTSAAGSPSLGLPKWFWGTVAFCAVLWFYRGRTISIPVPRLRFAEWLFVSILIVGSAWWDTVLPNWAIALTYAAIMALLFLLETLNEAGKKNYRRSQTMMSS
jgi:hypothetical protein